MRDRGNPNVPHGFDLAEEKLLNQCMDLIVANRSCQRYSFVLACSRAE